MGRGDISQVEGSPPVRTQRDVLLLDDVSAFDKWIATDSADTLVEVDTHVLGQKGLSFNKAAGAVDAGISRTLPALSGAKRFSASDFVELVLLLPGGAATIDEVILRLGTSSVNYSTWVFPRAVLHLGLWDRLIAEIARQDPALQVGVGMDLDNLRFAQVIVRTVATGQTFTGAVFDSLALRGS